MKNYLFIIVLFGMVLNSGCALRRTVEPSKWPRKPFSILQGVTTSSSTQISIVVPKKELFKFELVDIETHEKQRAVNDVRIDREFSDKSVVKMAFNTLKKNKVYEFRVLDFNGKVLDSRELKPLDQSIRKVRLGIMSCMDDTKNETEITQIWQDVVSQRPEMLLFIGDNVYVDINLKKGEEASEALFWNRYLETREKLWIYHSPTLIPTLAVWDDHDYGQNDGNKNSATKMQAKQVFYTFFAQDEVPGSYEPGLGVSSVFSGFGLKIFMLDDRSFRSTNYNRLDRDGKPTNQILPSDQTHFGKEQEEWFFSRLKNTKDPALIISGDQFFGGYHVFESYEGNHPSSFKKFLAQIKNLKPMVFFISGDRHLAELMKIPKSIFGYETYELTTSAIHASVYPSSWDKTPNPNQIEGTAGSWNYVIMDTLSLPGKLGLHLNVFGPNQKILLKKDLEIRK